MRASPRGRTAGLTTFALTPLATTFMWLSRSSVAQRQMGWVRLAAAGAGAAATAGAAAAAPTTAAASAGAASLAARPLLEEVASLSWVQVGLVGGAAAIEFVGLGLQTVAYQKVRHAASASLVNYIEVPFAFARRHGQKGRHGAPAHEPSAHSLCCNERRRCSCSSSGPRATCCRPPPARSSSSPREARTSGSRGCWLGTKEQEFTV